jgi:hypothetical protein
MAEIFNITGVCIQKELVWGDQVSIDVSGLTPGLYILVLRGSHEGSITAKFFKN